MNRIEKIKSIRNSLVNNEVSLGSWMQIPHASIAEIMGQSGYDWVAVDLEHGAIDINQLPDIFRALELGGTLPIARVAQGTAKDCKQALDAGAGGVIVPMINNAKQLIEIRDACRWPPIGKRGVGFSRANLFGKRFGKYSEEAQQPLIVAMIESIDALYDLDGILDVDGLDALFIGPYDLSASMDITGQFEKNEFKEAIHKINAKAANANIACGLHVVTPSQKELNERIAQGYQLLAYSIDSVFMVQSFECPQVR